MGAFREGSRAHVVCKACGKLRPITFQKQDVQTKRGISRNVLVGVCDVCGTVGAIPPESTTAIPDGVIYQRKAVASRVSKRQLNRLYDVCAKLGYGRDMAPTVFRYFTVLAARDRRAHKTIAVASREKADTRVSVKLNSACFQQFLKLEQLHGTRANAVRAVLEHAGRRILDERDPAVIKDIRRILTVS